MHSCFFYSPNEIHQNYSIPHGVSFASGVTSIPQSLPNPYHYNRPSFPPVPFLLAVPSSLSPYRVFQIFLLNRQDTIDMVFFLPHLHSFVQSLSTILFTPKLFSPTSFYLFPSSSLPVLFLYFEPQSHFHSLFYCRVFTLPLYAIDSSPSIFFGRSSSTIHSSLQHSPPPPLLFDQTSLFPPSVSIRSFFPVVPYC